MDPVSEIVPSSSIRVFLMMENRLLREALIRLLRKRSDLVVVGYDEPVDTTSYQVLESPFDVLFIASFQATCPEAKIVSTTGGKPAYKTGMIGLGPDQEPFMAAVRI